MLKIFVRDDQRCPLCRSPMGHRRYLRRERIQTCVKFHWTIAEALCRYPAWPAVKPLLRMQSSASHVHVPLHYLPRIGGSIAPALDVYLLPRRDEIRHLLSLADIACWGDTPGPSYTADRLTNQLLINWVS